MKSSQINLADYLKISHPTDGREGYLKKPADDSQEDYGYYERSQSLVDIYGNYLPYRFLPCYEGKLATPEELIYLGEGENGWPALVEAYKQFENNGTPFNYHTYTPCIGNTVVVTQREGKTVVNGEEVSCSIIALRWAMERFNTLPEMIGDLAEKYFLESYKDLEEDNEDIYFNLLSSIGVLNVIKIAQNNGHIDVVNKLQSWLAAGMTDQESRLLWANSTKNRFLNHTYYWKGVIVCRESYTSFSSRVKGICSVSLEEVEEVKARTAAAEAERKDLRNRKFEELSKLVSEKYGEEILKLALRKKGFVLAVLRVLSETSQIETSQMRKILAFSVSAPVIENLIICVANKVDALKAEKVAHKAYAWAYVKKAFPFLEFIGYFDEVKEALDIYSKNWK